MHKYTDHFGEKSIEYLQYRPHYPTELYRYLSNLATLHELAWDCGTGNGQAAVKLADYFKRVVASDVNQAQINAAIRKENVAYYCWPAEKTSLKDHSVDLITVAQALHWFNLESFYKEARRVIKRRGYLAAWSYSIGQINKRIDTVTEKLYAEILGDTYWAKERRFVDEEYKTIHFPFTKVNTPDFFIEKKMNFSQLVGYLNTWSAVKEYQLQNEDNPINLVFTDLQTAWGDPMQEYVMTFPIHLLVGCVE